MDRDNPVSDPKQTRTFALPSPIGLTEVNDPQNSLTKEVINKNIRDIEVGVGIVEIESHTGTAHTLTTELDHNLNRINVSPLSCLKTTESTCSLGIKKSASFFLHLA